MTRLVRRVARAAALVALVGTLFCSVAPEDARGQEPATVAAPVEAAPATPPSAPPSPVVAEPVPAAETVLEETPSPWSKGLVTSMIALFVGGVSAVLGIWVDRDKSRPLVFAGVMSVLITAAISVGAAQSYLDAEGAIQQRADLKRMLDMVNEIAVSSGDQGLADLVASEGGPKVTVPKLAIPTLSALPAADPNAAPTEAVDPAVTPTAAPAPTTP